MADDDEMGENENLEEGQDSGSDDDLDMSDIDMAAAMEEMGEPGGDESGGAEETGALSISDFGADEVDLSAIYDVPVKISVVLGRTQMQVNQLLKLGRGAVIELDKKVGEPIDILVNDKTVAKGEIVVVEDRVGITMTEILKSDKK